MVEQPLRERIGEGMIRVYLTHDEVIGVATDCGLRGGGATAGKAFELPTAPHIRRHYVLCDINAGSAFAFPKRAMPTVARAAIDRIADRR